MKKILSCTLLCITSFALLAQDIQVGESYSEDILYRNKKSHITISPDAESPRHFSAVIITGGDTLEHRYFTMQKAINLNDWEKLERDRKIVRDGLCIAKQQDRRTETSYEQGEKAGLEYVYKDGILFSETVFVKDKHMKERLYYPSGLLWAEISYEHQDKIADVLTKVAEYYESGKPKRVEIYNRYIDDMKRTNYTEEGKDTLFAQPFMRTATFPGGTIKLMQYISQNLKYPKTAAQNRIDGRVMVRYSIEKDGSISSIEVTRGVSPELDMEAIRMIKAMPKWRPCTIYGELTVDRQNLPVLFRLLRN